VDAEVNDTLAVEGTSSEDISPPADLLTYASNRQSSDHIPPAHLAKLMSDAINKHTSKSTNTRSINASITYYCTEPIVYSIPRSGHVDAYGGD
jgi:hypothetical protein